MKTKKWWFCFTLVATMVIATIITDMLYINGLEKIAVFAGYSVWIYFTVSMLQAMMGGKTNIVFVVSLLIFCSSSFFFIGKRSEFIVFHQGGQMPVVLERNLRLVIPYTYDMVAFNCHQALIIIDDNQKATVDFEFFKDSVLMIQHGFAGQKDFAEEIQKRADPRFFTMNDADRKAYLDSFGIYGLRWKMVSIEISNIK